MANKDRLAGVCSRGSGGHDRPYKSESIAMDMRQLGDGMLHT